MVVCLQVGRTPSLAPPPLSDSRGSWQSQKSRTQKLLTCPTTHYPQKYSALPPEPPFPLSWYFAPLFAINVQREISEPSSDYC